MDYCLVLRDYPYWFTSLYGLILNTFFLGGAEEVPRDHDHEASTAGEVHHVVQFVHVVLVDRKAQKIRPKDPRVLATHTVVDPGLGQGPNLLAVLGRHRLIKKMVGEIKMVIFIVSAVTHWILHV